MRWFLLLLVLCGPARAQNDALQMLKQPGVIGLMRHARAPGTGDPAGFRIDDCSTQRNLDASGREQAQQIGERLRAAGVAAAVFTSAWCRTRETAELLAVGPVEVLPALNSFFADGASRPAQTDAVRRFATEWTSGPLVLVTHQVNISALTGIFPADGEMVVLRRGPDGLVVMGWATTPPRP